MVLQIVAQMYECCQKRATEKCNNSNSSSNLKYVGELLHKLSRGSVSLPLVTRTFTEPR